MGIVASDTEALTGFSAPYALGFPTISIFFSEKIRMSFAPPMASACRRESPFTSWRTVGPLLMSVVFHLLITHTDACAPPPRYETMRLMDPIKDSYAPGESVKYQCRLGYMVKPSFARTAVCQADNSWTPLSEACTKKRCSNLGDPGNGRVIFTNETLEFGSQIDFVCDEGHYLIGKKTLYCEIAEGSVRWSGDPPICERVLCAPPPNIENGQYSNMGKEVFAYSDVVHYSCNRQSGSDQYSLVGQESLVCSANGEWSSEPPKCKVVKCIFPDVQNADRIAGLGTKFTYQSKVTFRCHAGFVINGSNTITCEEDGLWVPPIPQCVKASTSPTTKPPILSHSVSTAPVSTLANTVSPISNPSAVPTTPSSIPGYSPSTKQPPISGVLDGGSIAVIVVAVLMAGIVASVFLYKYVGHRRRGTYISDESHREVKFISL
ncbi:membrane cofactor protein isoform 3-T4 [Trichechus inunguis]|uniref:Membrane cofactor protein n=1 Tax=Trichechus manatus latirostris TaxID=127582 RepID=A0A2Y9R371_TRIMA|nr:membrane cofactor protein isoform X3 [Trichechus manatus latirostris]